MLREGDDSDGAGPVTNDLGRQLASHREHDDTYAPSDGSHDGGPDYRRSKHVGMTLGHYRRSKTMPFVGDAEMDVWRPCWSTLSLGPGIDYVRDADGRPIPHVYYQSSIGYGCQSILCRSCRVIYAAIMSRKRGDRILVCDDCFLPHRMIDGPKPPPIQGSLF